jgi:SAM-dependent methyltransferase
VLDIGSAAGSFDESLFALHVVRLDLDVPPSAPANFVRSDAAKLPFRTGCFDGVISNHSLEHFAGVETCLREMSRVLKPGGFLFMAVPDASTVTDRLYRWLSRGGGHINPFRAPREVIELVESATGIAHVATRTLCTSLSFLNRRKARWPRRAYLVGDGTEFSLRGLTFSFRMLDRWFGTRTRIYGWAFYFGASPDHVECWSNVCIRCGSGQSSHWLHEVGRVRKGWFGLRRYSCANCGADNFFTEDEALS